MNFGKATACAANCQLNLASYNSAAYANADAFCKDQFPDYQGAHVCSLSDANASFNAGQVLDSTDINGAWIRTDNVGTDCVSLRYNSADIAKGTTFNNGNAQFDQNCGTQRKVLCCN